MSVCENGCGGEGVCVSSPHTRSTSTSVPNINEKLTADFFFLLIVIMLSSCYFCLSSKSLHLSE